LGFDLTGGSFNSPAGTSVSTTTSTSFLGGAQVGVNYEFGGGVVIGAEAMFDWLPNTKNTVNLNNAASGANLGSATINNRWLTTATGKLGYAWDRVLLYAKGGGAWVGTNTTNATFGGAPIGFSGPTNNSGWTAGVGVEWAFAGNWSARAEYDYIGLTNQTFASAPTATSVSSSSRNIQLATAGLNYKFGAVGGNCA
jgi:outer membrane immunogenic protein